MGDTSVVYRHGDKPVAVNTTFLTRVQDFSVEETYPHTYVDEMGRALPVGLVADTQRFRATLRWLPIDNAIEQALFGVPVPISIADMMAMSAITVQSSREGITGARISRLEYSFTAGGDVTAIATLSGSGANDGASITVPAVSGVAAYRGRDVYVTIGSSSAQRVESVNVALNFTLDEPEELGSATPIGTIVDTPRLDVTINWWESTAMAGNTVYTVSSPVDIVIVLGTGSGKKKLTCYNMVTTGRARRGAVRGRATRRQTYMSNVSSSDGFVIDVTT